MTYEEIQNGIWIASNDPKRQTIDPGVVVWRLNEAIEQYAQATQILRVRTTVAITNGIGSLRPTPDSVKIAGKILRVEDPNQANRALLPTTEEELDTLRGLDWRKDATGSLKYYFRGKASSSTRDGYTSIGVYPLVASGSIDVHHVGIPRRVYDNADPNDIPDHLHLGIVYGATVAILGTEGKPESQGLLMVAQAQWDKWVGQGIADFGKGA